eukprot:snap_masked-scaffold_46-processed-gene-1.68-mRNA-1 protein AED:1.00 eAED:1.00 QI:0/0/0/0/1/1/2/0/82
MFRVFLKIPLLPYPSLQSCIFPASFFDVYITGFENINLLRVFKWLCWIRLKEGAFYISGDFLQGFGCIFVFQIPEFAAILDF